MAATDWIVELLLSILRDRIRNAASEKTGDKVGKEMWAIAGTLIAYWKDGSVDQGRYKDSWHSTLLLAGRLVYKAFPRFALVQALIRGTCRL